MKVLVFGQTGQVAREMQRRCPPEVSARFLSRQEADLMNPAACRRAVEAGDCDVVINAAAWTAVDKAETEEAAALTVNGAAPGAMAAACAVRGIPFLHVSTDYVFSGEGQDPFRPGDPTAPLGAYGRSKLAGEEAVLASGARALILRTSWVFSAHGTNFVRAMLRLGKERASLNVVADQFGGPTPAAAIADALFTAALAMAEGAAGGVHHFSGAPDTNWAGFARAIMQEAGLGCQVADIPSSAYPTPARRPLNSRLDCTALQQAFGIVRPDWRAALHDVVKELSDAA